MFTDMNINVFLSRREILFSGGYKMTRILGLSIIMLMAFCSVVCAAELPEATSISSDLVIATKDGEARHLKGYIINNSYVYIDLRKDKNDKKGIKVPQNAINYVFYADANNSAYIDGLKAYEAHKYKDAAEAFAEAAGALRNFKSKNQSDEFVQYAQYYEAMSHFRLGEYDQAIKLFDLALQPRDAIFKFQGEYYLARSLEGQGKYEDAKSKYSLLVNAVFPEMVEKAKWGEKWSFLCKLGEQRASLLASTQKPGQSASVESALAEFEKLIKEGGDKVDEEVLSDALMIRTSALKYLAQKNPENYSKVIALLGKPLRSAIANNDRASLSWMYLDIADSNWGLMESAQDAAEKKKYADNAFYGYLQLALVYDLPPAQLCKIYYRLGKLFTVVKGADWQKRSKKYYMLAASGKFKDFQPYVYAQQELKKIKE